MRYSIRTDKLQLLCLIKMYQNYIFGKNVYGAFNLNDDDQWFFQLFNFNTMNKIHSPKRAIIVQSVKYIEN